ncbi:MAG: ABC transporter ATP-binding protein [Pseudomonadota bacterium]
MTKALSIRGVSHSFGARKALADVNLEVASGQFCALLGLNGAGKTTLFSLITRLYDNVSGSIEVLGHDVRRQPVKALQHLGVVFQNRTVDRDLSVLQNLTYHAALHGLPVRQGRESSMSELDRIGLADRANDKIRDLSGGQARRVEIARALVHRPALLLLDEPSIGLDVGSRQDIQDHVRRLMHEDGLGVLWATHLMDEVQETDQAVVLHQGKVLASGPVGSIVAQAGTVSIKDAFTDLTGHKVTEDAA